MALSPSLLFHHLLLILVVLHHVPSCPAAGGSWSVLLESTGVSVMHMQLLPNNRVVMFDRTDSGPSNISLAQGRCPPNFDDCTAHSVEYDIATNSIRTLTVLSDVWCSSGSLMPDGNLVQTGGFNLGSNAVRVYGSCDTCDWTEIPNGLIDGRWYATNHMLPDNRQIVMGGRQRFNYEFFPKSPATDKTFDMPFLAQTSDVYENNLYPFVFLNTDGLLFVYANNYAIFLNYDLNEVVKTFPVMPDGHPRNYPSTGSAVLLPLHMNAGGAVAVEVLICGGAPKPSYHNAITKGLFDAAVDTCGRLKISDPEPQWVMETMPTPRLMSDMVLLPNGQVLIINGAMNGVAGWGLGRNPVLEPVIYRPDNPLGHRFEVQEATGIPRMYHSTAILVPDGRVLVGGSNPNQQYEFTDTLFATELRLEAFAPYYLDQNLSGLRPEIIQHRKNFVMRHGRRMVIPFTVPGPVDPKMISVTMLAPPFNTHSFSMNQRLVVLESGESTKAVGVNSYTVEVMAPASGNIAPTGFYLLFVVHNDIPSPGAWVWIH